MSANLPATHQPLFWSDRLFRVGSRYRDELLSQIDAADPTGSVLGPSRLLCASLAQLARSCYRSLGGHEKIHEVSRCAAMLSLLTKIDDQVIDGLTFHGRLCRDVESVEARVRTYLAPTLQSIVEARPATPEARCVFAAQLGRELRMLSGHPERLAHLLEVIADGWEVQARGVALLASHPEATDLISVRSITAQISGAWLLMITLTGTLPWDAKRALTPVEEATFHRWGLSIQSADSLADLDKDIAEGMTNSMAGFLLWQNMGDWYLNACSSQDLSPIYHALCHHDIDLACIPSLQRCQELSQDLKELPENAALLQWIHGFLLMRYIEHPMCQRDASHPAFQPHLAHLADTKGFLQRAMYEWNHAPVWNQQQVG